MARNVQILVFAAVAVMFVFVVVHGQEGGVGGGGGAAPSSVYRLPKRGYSLIDLPNLPKDVHIRSVPAKDWRDEGSDKNPELRYISDECYDAVSQYRTASSIPLCQQIFGWTSPAPVTPVCPHSIGFGAATLPFGACCNRNNDCATGFCDSYSRTCTVTCDGDGPTGACAEASAEVAGTALDGSGSVPQSCLDCLCPASSLCNQNEFCEICPTYVGPATRTVRQAAGCDVNTLPASDTTPLRQSPDCFQYLQFGGVNSSCAVALLTQMDLLLIANYTWCEVNSDGQLCGLQVDNVLSAISITGVSQTDTCAALNSAGCCVGNMLSAFIFTGDTVRYNHLLSWTQACGFHFTSCVSGSKLGGGAIAGIVVACVVGTAAIVAAIIWFIKSRKDEMRWRHLGDEEIMTNAPAGRMNIGDGSSTGGASVGAGGGGAAMQNFGAGASGAAVGGGGVGGGMYPSLPHPSAPAEGGASGVLDPRVLDLFVGGGGYDDDHENLKKPGGAPVARGYDEEEEDPKEAMKRQQAAAADGGGGAAKGSDL